LAGGAVGGVRGNGPPAQAPAWGRRDGENEDGQGNDKVKGQDGQGNDKVKGHDGQDDQGNDKVKGHDGTDGPPDPARARRAQGGWGDNGRPTDLRTGNDGGDEQGGADQQRIKRGLVVDTSGLDALSIVEARDSFYISDASEDTRAREEHEAQQIQFFVESQRADAENRRHKVEETERTELRSSRPDRPRRIAKIEDRSSVDDRAQQWSSEDRERAMLRALENLERATRMLERGEGRSAALLLASAATDARASVLQLDRSDPRARILGAVAINLRARAEGMRAIAPETARDIARRIERIASATDVRAEHLDAGGHREGAGFLRGLAYDSRSQAGLLFRSAAHTDELFGRSLAHSLAAIATRGRTPPSELGHAFAELHQKLASDHLPFHAAVSDSAIGALPQTKRFVPAFAQISRAFSEGRPVDANVASIRLLDQLRREPRLVAELSRIAQSPDRQAVDLARFRDRVLPDLVLRGIVEGGLGTLMKNGAGLRWWMEHVDVRRGGELLLGHPELFRESSVLLPAIPENAWMPMASTSVPEIHTAEPLEIGAGGGVEGVDGLIDGEDGVRWGYVLRETSDTVSSVEYQSMLDPMERRVRLDVELDPEDLDERKRRRATERRRRPSDGSGRAEKDRSDVAIVLFDTERVERSRLVGFADPFTAKITSDELTRLNAGLPEQDRIQHGLFADPRATPAHIRSHLARLLGVDNRDAGVLLVFCKGLPPQSAHADEPPPEERDVPALIATFLCAPKKTIAERIVGQDYVEDLELMQSGVLFYRPYAHRPTPQMEKR
jgi:hypothetical protein